jgi:hypothetical protein
LDWALSLEGDTIWKALLAWSVVAPRKRIGTSLSAALAGRSDAQVEDLRVLTDASRSSRIAGVRALVESSSGPERVWWCHVAETLLGTGVGE